MLIELVQVPAAPIAAMAALADAAAPDALGFRVSGGPADAGRMRLARSGLARPGPGTTSRVELSARNVPSCAEVA